MDKWNCDDDDDDDVAAASVISDYANVDYDYKCML